MTIRSTRPPYAILVAVGIVIILAAFAFGWLDPRPRTGATGTPALMLQATTTTENSGLLRYLLPKFTADTGIEVHHVDFGTGQALKNAAQGNADVAFVHDTASETAFVAAGHGVARHNVMYDNFVLVGPRQDPANVRGMTNIANALAVIRGAKAPFVSRGDDSGTHKTELRLWQDSGTAIYEPRFKWYRATGSGMGATLAVAVETNAYTLTSTASWAAFQAKGEHDVLVSNDPPLKNQYGVILVNRTKNPPAPNSDAQEFVAWLTGPRGQQAIAAFRIDGKQAFVPNAAPPATSAAAPH